MIGRRITIGGLVGLVVVSALGLAALRTPTPMVASLVFTAMLSALLIAGLCLAADVGRKFCLGFLIYGGGYAMLAFAPVLVDEVRPFLLTDRMIDDVYDRVGSPPGRPFFYVGTSDPKLLNRTTATDRSFPHAYYGPGYLASQRIGHSLAGLAHGVAGGVIVVALTTWRRRTRAGEVAS